MQILEDVRYALRQFAKAPGFTTTAILTLALGIGATTAIFTLVHAVLLKSLPVVHPEDLYRVGNEENCCVNGGMQDNWTLFSYEQYRQFRDNNSGFAELAAFQAGGSLIGVRRNGSNKAAESYRSEYVSGNYFSTHLAGEVWEGSVCRGRGVCDQRAAVYRDRDHSAGLFRRPGTKQSSGVLPSDSY
jgi:hypothetical protein